MGSREPWFWLVCFALLLPISGSPSSSYVCEVFEGNFTGGNFTNIVGEAPSLEHFRWFSGSTPVSVFVIDPPRHGHFFTGYHGPALPLSFRWRRPTLQCPAPDTRAHFLKGVIRTRRQCSLDSAPSPKAPAKPNPTRALKVRLDFFSFDDAPPRVGGGRASNRQRKKQKKKRKKKPG
jgi:hypothetical protein